MDVNRDIELLSRGVHTPTRAGGDASRHGPSSPTSQANDSRGAGGLEASFAPLAQVRTGTHKGDDFVHPISAGHFDFYVQTPSK